MGWVIMSERELNRIEVLSQVTQGRMTTTTAANVLGLSRRQVHRLLKVFQTDGAAAIRHKARGRKSNHRIDPGIRDYAIALVKEAYVDFGPTLPGCATVSSQVGHFYFAEGRTFLLGCNISCPTL
jgi:hypothetical protein